MAGDEERNQMDELYKAIERNIRCMPLPRCSIVKVPKKLRRVKEEAYIPEILSIGPFHRDKDSLKASTETKNEKYSFKAMEQHKQWYVDALLSRLTRDSHAREVKLQEFIKIMKSLEGRSRECYAEPIDLTSNQFVEMMLIDSCFILELFIRNNKNRKGEEFKNDPIFKTAWMMESLQRDLILLENQLPFFVLKDLFESIKDLELSDLSLTQLAVNFFDSMISSFGVAVQKHSTGNDDKYTHFLHLLHSILVPGVKPEDSNEASSNGVADSNQNSINRAFSFRGYKYLRCRNASGETRPRRWEYIHCATELQEAGVDFRGKKGATSLLNIEFHKNGVLEIPHLKLEDYTDTVIRNLLALEQCNDDYGIGITSYAAFLDSIISTKKDVKLLRSKEIIDCGLDDHDEATLAFNKLGDRVMVKDFYFAHTCRQANAYYRTDWHRWRSILKREYFKNPLKAVSLMVAFVITILTLTQTLYSVLSYYNRK